MKDYSCDTDPVLLITGGTGTLGLAVAGRIDWDGPIRILSRDEQKQQKLRDVAPAQIRLILGDIRDPGKLAMAFRGVDTVIHCAALKIVPNACYNPDEIVWTNAIGTLNVCRAAIEAGVRRVIVISSDKAVEPTTLYGATKMCGEHIAIQANNWSSQTNISVVRLGNIEASRGSITEWMADLARQGKTIPITHEGMTRFWISQEAAVKFIEIVLDEMVGGEIFVPKLSSTFIVDMIPKDAEYRVIGLRQTERLYEPLVGQRELEHTDEYPTYFVIRPYPYQGNTDRKEAFRSDCLEALGHRDRKGGEQ